MVLQLEHASLKRNEISDERNKDSQWIEELALKEGMRRLNEREKMILRKRFFQGKTQMEVADEIGISQAQVSRLEKAAIKDIAYKALQVRERLISETSREPTAQEIAKELEVSHEEIVFALDAIQDPVSLFEPIYNDGGDPIYVMDLQRFNNRGEYVDDLFQVGCIGLMKSIDNFDLSHNVKFSTYAVPMIIGEIRRYLRDNNPIRVSRSLRYFVQQLL
ncbi:hypothetical protein DT075_23860 [Bacillus licheniformis]|nr:hypothetical protein DT075_23860 [Bacillus licheniformis]